MTRRILFGIALSAVAAVPASPADAGQICLKVFLNGVLNHTVGQCVSAAPPTDCDSHLLQFPPSSSITLLYCVPTPIAP